MKSISNRNGESPLKTDKPDGFLKAVGIPRTKVWDGRIKFDQVLIDDNPARVWTVITSFCN